MQVRIDTDKEGIFTAGDIELPPEIEILNKDLALCTLDSDTHLGMEITINRGHGYVPFTKNKQDNGVIGTIPIDSIYSPVIKCNYEVSDTRVGNEMDHDKLTLELETDGSIEANDAVAVAATILINCFESFRTLATGPIPDTKGPMTGETVGEKETVMAIDLSTVPIEELELSVRAFNCLKRAEINMLDQLTDKTEDELGRVRNLGKKSIDEIKEKLSTFKNLGLHLKESKE